MGKNKPKNGIWIAPGRTPWPHELRAAQILAGAGHVVEFLPEGKHKSADILLDGVEFEIKSPRSGKTNSLEWLIRAALKQSPNIIIDSSRIKNMKDDNLRRFLIKQKQKGKQLKKMIFITRQGEIVDIGAMA